MTSFSSTSCQRKRKSFGNLLNERWNTLLNSQFPLLPMWELGKIGAISSNHLSISLICSTIPPCDLPLFSLYFLPSQLSLSNRPCSFGPMATLSPRGLL